MEPKTRLHDGVKISISFCRRSVAHFFQAVIIHNHNHRDKSDTTMASSTATATAPSTLDIPRDGRLRVDGTDPVYGDWRDDLIRDGYAVIKGAIPRERALDYADRMLALIESL